jgi:hypothetical protein
MPHELTADFWVGIPIPIRQKIAIQTPELAPSLPRAQRPDLALDDGLSRPPVALLHG